MSFYIPVEIAMLLDKSKDSPYRT